MTSKLKPSAKMGVVIPNRPSFNIPIYWFSQYVWPPTGNVNCFWPMPKKVAKQLAKKAA